MKTLCMAALCLLFCAQTLCAPDPAAAQPAEAQPLTLEIQAAILRGNLYFIEKKYAQIIEELPPALDKAKTLPGGEEYVIHLQKVLGSAYFLTDQPQKALSHLREALRMALAAYGPVNDNSIALQSLCSYAFLNDRQYPEAKAFGEETLVGNTEMNGPQMAGSYFNTLYMVAAASRKKNLMAFYAKIAAAHYLSAGELVAGQLDSDEYRGLLDTLQSLLIQNGVVSDAAAFTALMRVPNRPEDTPYTRGRDWMRGPEVELYARYGEVAANLEEAGKRGSDAQKEAARKSFRNWFADVDRAFP